MVSVTSSPTAFIALPPVLPYAESIGHAVPTVAARANALGTPRGDGPNRNPTDHARLRINATPLTNGRPSTPPGDSEVAAWSEQDFERVTLTLRGQEQSVMRAQSELSVEYARVEPLLSEARRAEDAAAAAKAAYDALNAQFEPALADYNRLAQERTTLEALIQAELQQKAQAETRLAHLDEIKDKRGRREQAAAEANYQISNSDQKISDAQTRVSQLNAQMQSMQAWGLPLMEQTQAAKTQWEATLEVASENNRVASTQGDAALAAAEHYQASVTALSAQHAQWVAYLQAHPDVEGAEQAQESLQASLEILGGSLQTQRAWTDAARARSAALDARAGGLEAHASQVQAELDPLQPARLQAQAQISARQSEYDTAQAAEVQAQADLDAAYQQRTAADNHSDKGNRYRARDEANRRIEFHSQQLSQATQARQSAAAALVQAQAQGQDAMRVALEVQGKWEQSAAPANHARHQALVQASIGSRLLDLELATQSALAVSHHQLVDLSQVKVSAAAILAAHGKISVDELMVLEDDLQADLNASLGALGRSEHKAINDRVAVGQEGEQLATRQARALGGQLIAENLVADAAAAQQSDQSADLQEAQTDFSAAQERLKNAQWAAEVADMHLDWAQGKVDPHKQAKALKGAQPALGAAQTERADAQLGLDQAQAELSRAQHLSQPLQGLTQETGFAALSALQRTQTQDSQADTQWAWASLAQARYQASDRLLATVQTELVQRTSALADIQHLIAQQVDDPEVAQQMATQSARRQQWAHDYADSVADTRLAQQQTDLEQDKLNVLQVQAGGTQALQAFLAGQVERVGEAYAQAKAQTPELEHVFETAAAQSEADRGVAEHAHGQMVASEKNAEIDFIATRRKHADADQAPYRTPALMSVNAGLSAPADGAATTKPAADAQNLAAARTLVNQENEKFTAQARTNPDEFIQAWGKTEMKGRKTERKQLHWFDDKAQWVSSRAEVQAARQQALQTIQAAQQSSQAAIAAGEALQAHALSQTARAMQWLDSHGQWGQATAASAELSARLSTQAEVLGQAVQSEKATVQKMLVGLTDGAGHGDDFAFENAAPPLIANAQIALDYASRRSTQASAQALQWRQHAQDLRGTVLQVHAAFVHAKKTIDQDALALVGSLDGNSGRLTEVMQASALALQAKRSMADRARYDDELHGRRVRADQVEKANRRKSLFSTLVHAGSLLAAAAVTIVAPPVGAALTETLLAAAAAGAGVNAAAQGINLAAGFQTKFDAKSMAAMASVAVFGTVMGTVTTTIDKLLRGTVLGNAVPGSAAVRTLLVQGNPLVEPVSMAMATVQPAVAAVPAGSLSWLGTALSWGTGATVGSVARQTLEVATGLSDAFSWNRVQVDALSLAMGGVMRTHWSSSWAGNPFTPTLYRPMGAEEMVVDVGKRVAGTLLIDVALRTTGLIDHINGERLLGVGAARGVQMVLRDTLGRLVITPTFTTPGAFVASNLGQSLIRTSTVLTASSMNALLGEQIDWNTQFYRGIGRVVGQSGAVLGEQGLARGMGWVGSMLPSSSSTDW